MPRRYFIVNLRLDELRLIEGALAFYNSSSDYQDERERTGRLASKIRSIRERIESKQAKDRYQTLAAKGNYNV